MANSVDPDQTAPIGAVFSGSTLLALVLNSSVMLAIICSRQLQQTTFSNAFFLGALNHNRCRLFCLLLKCFGSKKEGKDQESIQSSTTTDLGYHM